MKKARSVALIGAGNLTGSFVSKFYWLSGRLGPIKSSSFRLASRIANQLRAGHPVKTYEELQSCHLLLVCVPDSMLDQVLGELTSAQIDLHGKSIVLCHTWFDSGELQALCALGASVGSIGEIPGFDDSRYLIEGDKLAVLSCRRLVEHAERRSVIIERAFKPFYLAALTCTSSVLFSVVFAAAESLRLSGVTSSVSASILEKQVGRTLRSYVRAGRKAFPTPRELSRQLDALSAVNPELARFLEQSSRLAERLLDNRASAAAAD